MNEESKLAWRQLRQAAAARLSAPEQSLKQELEVRVAAAESLKGRNVSVDANDSDSDASVASSIGELPAESLKVAFKLTPTVMLVVMTEMPLEIPTGLGGAP